ncbi:uncharacterized protein J5F26_016989 isoform 2-T2 [Ciconia maguari]
MWRGEGSAALRDRGRAAPPGPGCRGERAPRSPGTAAAASRSRRPVGPSATWGPPPAAPRSRAPRGPTWAGGLPRRLRRRTSSRARRGGQRRPSAPTTPRRMRQPSARARRRLRARRKRTVHLIRGVMGAGQPPPCRARNTSPAGPHREGSKPQSQCCCQKKKCLWKLLWLSGIALGTPILPRGPMFTTFMRRAMDAPRAHAQTCTASYVVLRRYLPKPQSHQEAPVPRCPSRFC